MERSKIDSFGLNIMIGALYIEESRRRICEKSSNYSLHPSETFAHNPQVFQITYDNEVDQQFDCVMRLPAQPFAARAFTLLRSLPGPRALLPGRSPKSMLRIYTIDF
jgi:hypothetical protein